jgi:PAS domain S-box-containing protein
MDERVAVEIEEYGVITGCRWNQEKAYPTVNGIAIAWADITERKKSEEKLREAQERFRALVESTSDIIWQVDEKAVYTYVSPKVKDILGYEPEEVIGKTPFDLLDEDDETKIIDVFLKSANKKEPFHGLQNWNVHKNGSRVLLETSGVPILDEMGQLMGYRGIDRDITERRKAEESLRQSEERFSKAFQATATAMAISNFDGKYVDINCSFESLTGFTRKEVVGKTAIELCLYAEPSERMELIQQLKKTGTVFGHETNLRSKTGQLKKVLLSFEIILLNNEPHVLSSAIDITERKQAEDALRKLNDELEKRVTNRTQALASERERFFNMLDNLPVMVCLITADYKIPFANRLFREKFGDSKGRCCYEYIGSVDAPCKTCESIIPLKTDKPHHRIVNLQDGTIVDAYDYPFVDVDGTKMVLEVDVDITERVNLQEKLQEKERLAAIGQTAGMVGHDLRNPLQSITGEVYLAKGELDSLPDGETKSCLQESIQTIEAQVSYMDKIVSDLQTFVKPVEAQMQIINLKPLIAALIAQKGIPKNIQANIQVQGALTVQADPQLLKRVLINLITNAEQAMPDGGELTVKAHGSSQGKVQIIVEDTGNGIPEEIKSKIFTPLFTTKSKGQGFGLAVCKRVIEAQGGTITFESQVGKGTKFIIELPLK